jgi:hypothetical protein
MIYTDSAAERLACSTVRARPSPMGRWLKAAFPHRNAAPAQAHTPRDRTREAEKLRTWATTVRQTDPRFADDLFAAADRHEREE